MKLVTAVIRKESLNPVLTALEAYGVTGLTVSEASGFGRQKGRTQVYRGAAIPVDLVPKIKLELVVKDVDAIELIDVIVQAANTGAAGDGKVWVTTDDRIVRVSDRAEAEAAL